MKSLQRRVALMAGMAATLLSAGCTTTSLVLGAVGVATDTSMSWAIVKHVHDKLTDGDPVSCLRLDSVSRALSPRCGPYQPGSLKREDLAVAQVHLQGCPLAIATADARLWPVLPELLDKGAQPESCLASPLVKLALQPGCPDFRSASPEVLHAIAWMAEADARAIRHDVVRVLSCPGARSTGLAQVLDRWQTVGALNPDTVGFGVLGALHPDYLDSGFARRLEATGHTARAALAPYEGKQRPGFEEALRSSHWVALDWWLTREPTLANSVPPLQGDQLPWLPLARVLVPSFLDDPERQRDSVEFLLAYGANPRQKLPHSKQQSVISHAVALKSPHLALLQQPPALKRPPTAIAATAVADGRVPPRAPQASAAAAAMVLTTAR